MKGVVKRVRDHTHFSEDVEKLKHPRTLPNSRTQQIFFIILNASFAKYIKKYLFIYFIQWSVWKILFLAHVNHREYFENLVRFSYSLFSILSKY